jgi:spermidine synthase
MKRNSRTLFFLIFTASGFAGLIYESLWTYYLRLFLGHAAYAQTLVLAVFMGGLALGSWVSARYSRRWGNLLLGYAVVEAAVGVLAVLFHPLFTSFLHLAFDRVIPSMGSAAVITVFKWTMASLFILPQSVLLGMTFPLLSAGVIRRYPNDPGATLAMLYFTNSIGAAVGVLASGFLFIAWVGLPGTLLIAAGINIAVAVVVWRAVRGDESFAVLPREVAPPPTAAGISSYAVLLVVAFLTGLSSLIYEIGWIRMLNLVLSSSTHAFELMLSAFITGLALGGLWVRRRIDGLDQPVRFLAWVQIAMGGLALATLFLYNSTFDVMAWLVMNLQKTPAGYALFNISSHAIALVVMLPATFCAGMTLPLITAVLLREGRGEKSIGFVYAVNTVGCIAGVLVAVHLAMPLLGLKGMMGLGAGIDIALGLVLAWRAFPSPRVPVIATAAAAAVLLVAMTGARFDVHKMSSGVYRTGRLFGAQEDVLFQRDGKTATVSVMRFPDGSVTIATNGKPDASIQMGGSASSIDESTQIMLGAVPLIFAPHATTAAVVGWGSGMTTDVLLTTPQLSRVDSVEIEPLMVKAAELFRPRVELAYTDPRSHIVIEDAKTFFSTYNRKYDIIISEPSNPWVSGVSGLFSKEFYGNIRSHLRNDGLLVQWLHLYEIDMPLVASVFEALASQFDDYRVFITNKLDILIIARPVGAIPAPDATAFRQAGLAKELQRIGINGLPDLLVHRFGDRRALEPLFESFGMPANSDYHPLLDLYAARTLFLGTTAMDLATKSGLTLLPALEMLGQGPARPGTRDVTFSAYDRSRQIYEAAMLNEYILHGRWTWDHPEVRLADAFRTYADMARRAVSDCSAVATDDWWNGMFYMVGEQMLPFSAPHELSALLDKAASTCASRLSSPQKDFVTLLKAINRRDASSMSATARKLLEEMPAGGSELRAYVLAAGMLGDLAAEEKAPALALWEQYGNRLNAADSGTLLMRLLVAHAERAGAGAVAAR